MHSVADEHDTARARPDSNPGMPVGVDQFFPLKVTESPEPATAKQNDEVGQDTENNPLVSTLRLPDHLLPSKVSVCPLRFTATHSVGVGHDRSIRRSLRVPVEEVWNVDHDLPLNVPTVLGPPGAPLAPTAAQKVVVGQETSYVAGGPTDTGDDHDRPS